MSYNLKVEGTEYFVWSDSQSVLMIVLALECSKMTDVHAFNHSH